jgi:protein SCO1
MASLAATVGRIGEQAQDRASKLVGRPGFWITFVIVIAALPILRMIVIQAHMPPPLPVIATVPDFKLQDQNSQPFGSDQLKGRVWVADFIFTRCPTICPLITQKMQKIQHRLHNLGPAAHLVSFTADPDYDTPARLLEFAEHHRVSPRMWSFLTGPPESVKTTVIAGLKVSMGREGPEDDVGSVFHGTHFVVVDQRMRIRGYYDSSSEEAIERLIRDVGLLVNRGD